jgi:hypothetical protein
MVPGLLLLQSLPQEPQGLNFEDFALSMSSLNALQIWRRVSFSALQTPSLSSRLPRTRFTNTTGPRCGALFEGQFQSSSHHAALTARLQIFNGLCQVLKFESFIGL